ncbi:MAG: hypothetical protein SOV58_05320 [Candidatus Enteromonas sp.]|nr:hypothetical protein [Candidatus Enteromonas sp.]
MSKGKKTNLHFILGVILGLLGIALALVMILVGVIPGRGVVVNGHSFGLFTGIAHFFRCFVPDPGLLGTGMTFWSPNMSLGGFIGVFATVVSFILTVIAVIVLAKKHAKVLVAEAIVTFLASLCLAGVWSVVINGLVWRSMWYSAQFWLTIILLLGTAGYALLALDVVAGVFNLKLCPFAKEEEPAKEETAPAFDEEACRRIADEEIQKHVDNFPHGITIEKADEIVAAAMEKHVEELHTEYVDEETSDEETSEEETVEETPAEEPVEEETSEEAASEEAPKGRFDGFASIKRVPFEERLASADEDIQKKYQELRSYILSYGVRGRISIPGDTYSAHRERLVFLTIAGKHIKAYFALNPADYENSKTPLISVESKKFEDLPACLKVKSDLSFRRALKLIDDVMAAKQITKPEDQ